MTVYKEVPTREYDGTWTITIFETQEDFKSFITPLFKEPGKYEFDELSFIFNEQARNFEKNGFYCSAPVNSKDFIKYWGALKDEDSLSEKSKCRNGVIFKGKDKSFYLTRDYYFWLNFLKIKDKKVKKLFFPEVWDVHYHIALYELLAELNYKHVALLKKRQIGSTFFHLAKLLNIFWFEDSATLKIGASVKDYINEKSGWKILSEYRDFLNTSTGWYRKCIPDKVFMWQQKDLARDSDGKETVIGNKSTITGHTFEKDPTAGVGGDCNIFYHEEAGIAPKMDTTYEFIRPALSIGQITTGLFIAAGSVGDLDQCQPLKEMILNPNALDIYAVESTLIDDNGTFGVSGLFIPEQWSMPPFIDKYGNSLVEEALASILEERAKWKKNKLDADKYQLRISQKPINIHEAFAFRRESIFPLGLVNKQILRIEENKYPEEHVDLERDGDGKIQIKTIYKEPITTLGNKVKSLEDKTGVICMYKRPPANIEWGRFYASIDPVKDGKSDSSESLCSIFVYETDTEVTRIEGSGPNANIENKLDRGGLVLSWCGRFDDLKKTHERLEMICDLYQAQIICEANVSEFITYMQHRKKQHMLVTRQRLLSFNKDMKGLSETYQEYGWKNSTPVFQHLLAYTISYLKEELDVVTKPDGTIVKTTYGIERIPDIMLLREMQEYQSDRGNYDRLVAFAALVTFISVETANRGFRKTVEKVADLEKSDKFRNFIYGGPEKPKNPWAKPTQAFRHMKF